MSEAVERSESFTSADGPDPSEVIARLCFCRQFLVSCVVAHRGTPIVGQVKTAIEGSREHSCGAAPNPVNNPGIEAPMSWNPLSDVLVGSLWRLEGLLKKEHNGRMCRLLSIEGKVAKMTFVGDNCQCGPMFRVNCSRLVRPDEYGVVVTETDEQICARYLAQKEFYRLGRLGPNLGGHWQGSIY